eukprot:scaffold112117_cov37-Cyclotella_meneghiniana.AAC.1
MALRGQGSRVKQVSSCRCVSGAVQCNGHRLLPWMLLQVVMGGRGWAKVVSLTFERHVPDNMDLDGLSDHRSTELDSST